jgi:hypothetical protein
MRWLKAVIAQLAGLLQRPAKTTASQTQAAGPASQVRTALNGSDYSVPVFQLQPAKSAAKRAKKPASKTKAAAKRTPAKAPAQTRTARRSGASGR